jgi:hypothetical protein
MHSPIHITERIETFALMNLITADEVFGEYDWCIHSSSPNMGSPLSLMGSNTVVE